MEENTVQGVWERPQSFHALSGGTPPLALPSGHQSESSPSLSLWGFMEASLYSHDGLNHEALKYFQTLPNIPWEPNWPQLRTTDLMGERAGKW